MGKTIKIIKRFSFIIILLEIVLGAAFAVIYFENFFDLQSRLANHPLVLVLAMIILMAVNCLFVWIVTLLISTLRQKTDLKAAEVIGSDVQEAYNFAMIGLAITDDNNTVLWTNDLFKSRHIEIMDMDIISWQPDLAPLRDSSKGVDQVVKIALNSSVYQVKLLPEAGLWIFKDVTDYEQLFKNYNEQAPVIGILAIDNYDDVVRGDDDFNDVVTKVKSDIFSYAKDFGILLRRIKDDSYSMLCNFASYQRMLDDKFSIIDKVRSESSRSEIPLTLSVGIAYDFPDVNKLNDLANDALDIAMSRGGDQVVVSAFGQEMQFFGGKTEAQEKRNRVHDRERGNTIINLINASSNILIMGHANMDMDAFGACLGIKAICNQLKKDSRIVADLKNTETKTRAAMTTSFGRNELEKIIINSKDAESLINADTLLFVVDVHTQSMTMAPRLVDKANKKVVIDHHRRAEEFIAPTVLNVIEPSASSTCEILAEFIRFSTIINPRIELPSSYATIMLSGILLDSSFFRSKSTGIRTFEAATILKEYGADNSRADDFLKDTYEEHKEVAEITSNLEYPNPEVVIAVANKDGLFDHATIAKAANMCLTFKGVRAAFVVGRVSQRETRVSVRSDGSINVSVLAEKLGGGGHFTSAAATFVGAEADLDNVKQRIITIIQTSLDEAKNSIKDLPRMNEEGGV